MIRDKQATLLLGRATKPKDLYSTASLCLLPSGRCSWRCSHSTSERHGFRGRSAESDTPGRQVPETAGITSTHPLSHPRSPPDGAVYLLAPGATHGPGTCMLRYRSQDRHL